VNSGTSAASATAAAAAWDQPVPDHAPVSQGEQRHRQHAKRAAQAGRRSSSTTSAWSGRLGTGVEQPDGGQHDHVKPTKWCTVQNSPV
jgi:hypothetical protein